MIAHLQGQILDISESSIVIDVHGVGYHVSCTSKCLQNLRVGEAIMLHIEMVVREDAMLLYGFVERAEKSAFQLLRTVQGVGARMALSILSTLSVDDLVYAIGQQDKAKLAQAEGVGPKLALRICTELKDKAPALGYSVSPHVIPFPNTPQKHHDDIVSALMNLGYKRAEALHAAQRAYEEFPEDTADFESMIRHSLKQLAR